MKHQAHFTKDLANKKIHVTRAFDAPLEKVWKAWTVAGILDQWWAPRPWKTETKSLEFRPGGLWLYAMVGPTGDRHHCRVEFTAITPQQSFEATSGFCDENDVPNTNMPLMHWYSEFSATATGTQVSVTLGFDTDADLATIVQMGFEAGFSMGLGNLDELLEESVAV
jgi:uncharacterized protein YndB with AHSA1/START domain